MTRSRRQVVTTLAATCIIGVAVTPAPAHAWIWWLLRLGRAAGPAVPTAVRVGAAPSAGVRISVPANGIRSTRPGGSLQGTTTSAPRTGNLARGPTREHTLRNAGSYTAQTAEQLYNLHSRQAEQPPREDSEAGKSLLEGVRRSPAVERMRVAPIERPPVQEFEWNG